MKKPLIELSVNDSGDAVIKITHHDRDNGLENKLLGSFIKKASEKGIEIKNIGGALKCGTNNSVECYEIEVK